MIISTTKQNIDQSQLSGGSQLQTQDVSAALAVTRLRGEESELSHRPRFVVLREGKL